MVSALIGGLPGAQSRVPGLTQRNEKVFPLRVMLIMQKRTSRNQPGEDEWKRVLDAT